MTSFSTERLSVVTFTERPDLLPKVFAPEIQSAVPEFMRHDPIGTLYFGRGQLEHYGEFGLAAIGPANPRYRSPAPSASRSHSVTAPRDVTSCRMAGGTKSPDGPISTGSQRGDPLRSARLKSWWHRSTSGAEYCN
jgi:hypothetical protein